MAREEENSAISLFSFQDIITSLTGIMFLVVLMLLLMVLSPHGFLTSETTPEMQALQNEVQTLHKELEQLSGSSEDLKRELEKLNHLSESELVARLDAARTELARLKAEEEAENRQLRAAAVQNDGMRQKIAQIQEFRAALEQALPPLEQREKELTQLAADTEARLRRREKVMNFTVPRPSGKTPQLLELSADGVRLLVPDDGREENFRVPGQGVASLVKFRSYLAAHRGEGIYFCAVVRPDGFRLAGTLLALLDEAGFERGIEFLPANDLTIFDEATP